VKWLKSRPANVVLAAFVLLSAMALPSLLVTPADAKEDPFTRTWARTDYPVANREVSRTWMWGEKAYSPKMPEDYKESPGGTRTVVYWDKSRMEDNSFNTTEAPWDVSNGLLVMEMVSGRLQLGDSTFENRSPANENIAGDSDDTNGPTFAAIAGLLNAPPVADGSVITQRISRNGSVTNDPNMASYGVTAAWRERQPGLDHQVASVFWTFMNSRGTVYEDAKIFDDQLFENSFYATGLPITEAYWADVKVAGTVKPVLIQCFERRCLTYTPGNDPNWRVEAGNVGQQYYVWRYGAPPGETPTDADDNRTLTMGQSLDGTIDPQTDLDTYFFDATAGQRVSVGIRAVSGSTLDSVLTIYAPDGTVVNDPVADDDRGGWRDALSYNLPLPASGRYKATVESYSAKSSGGYSIALQPDDGAPTEGPIIYSSELTDWNQTETDQSRWYSSDYSYHVLVKPNQSGVLAWNQTTDVFGDFSASVYLRRFSPASRSIGCLVVRSSLSSGDGASYRLCIWGNGYESFGSYAGWFGGAYSETEILPFEARTAAYDADQWNILKIIASGNHLWFYINGVLVGDTVHSGPLQGAVGIQVGAEDNSAAEFEFFSLTVRSISGP
jgi:hypothetical protein